MEMNYLQSNSYINITKQGRRHQNSINKIKSMEAILLYWRVVEYMNALSLLIKFVVSPEATR
jgi:hypothetical protein